MIVFNVLKSDAPKLAISLLHSDLFALLLNFS